MRGLWNMRCRLLQRKRKRLLQRRWPRMRRVPPLRVPLLKGQLVVQEKVAEKANDSQLCPTNRTSFIMLIFPLCCSSCWCVSPDPNILVHWRALPFLGLACHICTVKACVKKRKLKSLGSVSGRLLPDLWTSDASSITESDYSPISWLSHSIIGRNPCGILMRTATFGQQNCFDKRESINRRAMGGYSCVSPRSWIWCLVTSEVQVYYSL